MTTALTLQHLGPMPDIYRTKSKVDAGDLGAGIGQAFATLGFKGKVWAITHRGQTTPLMREDGSGPKGTIEVVIVKASPVISKLWYEKGYVEGDRAPPDCWSVNGHSPDPASPKKQSLTCAGCKQNMWGSRVSEAGKAGKACSDSKRLAIVPAADIKNEVLGGAILLRVPPASLAGLSQINAALQAQGLRYDAVVMELGFDHTVAHPELTFKPLRVVNEAEAELIIEHQESDMVQRMLSEAVDQVRAEQAGNQAQLVAPLVNPVQAQPVQQVAPNPFAGAQPQPTYDAGPIPAGLVRTAAGGGVSAATSAVGGFGGPAPVVQQQPVQQQPVQQQPVQQQPVQQQPVQQQAPVQQASPEPELDMTPSQLAGETQEQFLARLQKIIAAQAAPKTRKPRARVATPSPEPTNSGVPTAPVQQVAAVQQVQQAPVAGGDMSALDAELDNLL